MFRCSAHIAAVLLLAATTAFAADPLPGEPFALRVGESVTVDGLMVGFNGIQSDSRCPREVECVWEGDAAAGMWARPGSRDITSFVLHTAGGFAKSQDVERYRVTLLNVNPYPVYPQPIDPGSYTVLLVVTSVEQSTPTIPTTWGSIKSLYGGP